jgi:hypothetical protein
MGDALLFDVSKQRKRSNVKRVVKRVGDAPSNAETLALDGETVVFINNGKFPV